MTSEQAKERAWVAKAIETWTRRHRRRPVLRAIADFIAESAPPQGWSSARREAAANALDGIAAGIKYAKLEQGAPHDLTKCQDEKA